MPDMYVRQETVNVEDMPPADPIAELTGDQVEAHILKRVGADFDYAQVWREYYDLEVQESRRVFNGRFLPDTVKKFGTKLLFLRKAAWIVYRLLAEIMSKYFEREHLARVGAVNAKGTTSQAAKIVTQMVRWHLRNSIKAYLVIEDAILDAAVDNTACVKAGWDQDTWRPYWETIPWEDVFPDPDARTQEELRYVIHEKEVDFDYLRKKGSMPYEKGGFINVDKVIKYVGERNERNELTGKESSPGTSDNKQRQLLRIREYTGTLQLLPEDVVERVDRDFGPRPETVPMDVVVTTYEDQYLLRIEPNTYGRINTFFGRLLKPKKEGRKTIYGESIVQLLKDLSREHNSIRNQRRRATKRQVAGRIIVGRNAGLDMRQLKKSEEGGIVYATNPKEAVPVQMPDLSRGFDGEIKLNDGDFQEAAGVPNITKGLESGSDTATEATIMAEMGMARMGHSTRVFNLTLVAPLVEFTTDMIIKWEDPQRVARIIGEPVPPLNQLVDRELEVVVEGGVQTLPTQTQIQQVQMGLQTIIPLMQAAPQIAVPTVIILINRLLELLPLEEVEQFWEMITKKQGVEIPSLAEMLGPGGGEGSELAGRGTFAAEGQPRSEVPVAREPVVGNVQGGMNNALR